MDIVKSVKEGFLSNEQKVLSGELVGLPWGEVFPKIGQFMPVIPPSTPVMITANSGVGKSNAWVGIILFSLYKLKKLYPQRKYKIKFLIALLEDTKEMLITKLFSMILISKYNIRADSLTLNSRRGLLSKEIKDKLDDVEKEIDDLLSSHCEIIDSVYNPTGLYKWARYISTTLGTHHNKTMDFSREDGTTYKKDVYSHYVPNDPNEQVILIVDNLNNLQQEKEEEGKLLTERETINKWTRKYTRLQIAKHWGWSVINIMQQSAESEKIQYDMKGNVMIDKCKPDISGLGNSKECARDHLIIFGLFAPNRYGVSEYEGYNIGMLKDSYRSFIIIKSNISETNKEIPMYFDGAASIFLELPSADKMTPQIYENIKNRNLKYLK